MYDTAWFKAVHAPSDEVKFDFLKIPDIWAPWLKKHEFKKFSIVESHRKSEDDEGYLGRILKSHRVCGHIRDFA